ncbi:hypothetical protein [Ferruginibacter profundus]
MKTAFNLATLPVKPKYGVTENKKAELDYLTNLVLDAQHKVEELQAIVTALTAKSADYDAMLTLATTYRATALNNNNLVTQVIQNALSLFRDSDIAFLEMSNADARAKTLATKVKNLVDKLIFSAQLINKLTNQVVRQKSLNPLISDELVELTSTAGTDANNAVALTLLALNSTFAAQASCLEAEACSSLEFEQAIVMYEVLTSAVLNAENKLNLLNGREVTFMADPDRPWLLEVETAKQICTMLKSESKDTLEGQLLEKTINFDDLAYRLSGSGTKIGIAGDYERIGETGFSILLNTTVVPSEININAYTKAKVAELVLTTNPEDGPWYIVESENSRVPSLQNLLAKALQQADENYNTALRAKAETIAQLSVATANLSTAQVNLNSLQSGLAAANAAAFAA